MRCVMVVVLAIASSASAQPARKPILIGVEYAYPGGAETFARLGVPAVKLYPDSITWGDMQAAPGAPIDFSRMDRFVSEYQKAGFTDLVLVLKSTSRWASKNYLLNLAPKPLFLDAYEAWVREVVERYDGDGKNDMPGLKHPVRYFEVGSEFSSFEPETAEEYIPMLERAHRGAHSASDKVVVLHAAFLTPTVFRSHPKPEKYAPEFARVEERVKMHGLDGMRKVLDAHKHFDMINFHALTDPIEIEDTMAWLRYEMRQRKFEKPIMISDTMPNPLIGWGPATRMPPPTLLNGPNFNAVGIMIHPASEEDRPALNDYFNKLINGDKSATDWNHAFVAADMIKKVAIAAEQGAMLINTSFMEDLGLFKSRAMQAGAGTSAWAGMAETEMNVLTQERAVKSLRPGFYAIQQLQKNIKGYQSVERVKTYDAKVRMYRFAKGDAGVYVAWYDPGKVLPNTKLPNYKYKFEVKAETLTVEKMIDKPGQTKAESSSVAVKDGKAELTLTPWPVFVLRKE
jgi:hypothetical protein